MAYNPAVRLIDELGVPYGVRQVDNKPRVSAMTYLQDIAEGNVPGHTVWTKIGYTPAMNTTENDIWGAGGVYVPPTAAQQMEVVSGDNTQDKGTVLFSGTSTGGSTTTLIDTGKDFTSGTPVAAGDCVILDKSGSVPEFGYVTSVSATTLTVSGGFSQGGTGSTRAYSIVDKSAFTGAQAVKIEYLDASYATKYEIVILNGTSAVATVNTNLFRINSFRLIATGSLNKCLGAISLRALADTPVYTYITAGYTRARNIFYTVPAGKTLYIIRIETSFATSGSPNKEYARLYTRANVEPSTKFYTGSLFYPYTDIVMQNTSVPITLDIPTRLPEKTDLKVSGIASASGISTVTLRGWLE